MKKLTGIRWLLPCPPGAAGQSCSGCRAKLGEQWLLSDRSWTGAARGLGEEFLAALLPPGSSREAAGTSARGDLLEQTLALQDSNGVCSSRCMESSLLLSWAQSSALTLGVLLAAEPAGSSLQVMSWLP